MSGARFRPTRRRAAAFAAALVLAALGVAGALRARPGAHPAAAVIEVQPGVFEHTVEALGRLAAVKTTRLNVPAEGERACLIAWLAGDGVQVRAGDVVARFDDTDMRRELLDGRDDAAAAGGKLARVQVEAETRRRSLTLDRDVATRESAGAADVAPRDPQIFSRHEIVNAEIDRELVEARREAAERKLALAGRQDAAEEGLARVEADKARQAVGRAERGLRRLELRAPHDGLLLLARNWRSEMVRTGQVVYPGEELAEIPDLSTLRARVHVLEADAGGLEVGRLAQVRVEGAGAAPLEARVERVDTLAKPRERGSPVRYFETDLALAGHGRGFRPGQRVRATVVLGRLENVLAVPRAALFEREGRRVVHVIEGGRPRAVAVTVGRNSTSHVVIESGLSPGDRVLLRDPQQPLDALGAPRRDGHARRAPGGPR